MRLDGKTAIITGAGGNIGIATARKFHAEGANLMLADRDRAALDRAVAELPEGRVETMVADVTDRAQNDALAEAALSAFGAIHVFFGNAGIEGVVRQIPDYPRDTFDKVMEVNVTSLFLGLQAILPRIVDGGSIILTSSIAGLQGSPTNIAYTTSKHAVIGVMRSGAAAGGPRGVRVNSIHPGFVDSEMLRRLIAQHPDPEAFEASLLARTKLGRFITTGEIADAVCFLASDESRALTSQTITIDGGVLP